MENRPPKNSRDITLIRDYRVTGIACLGQGWSRFKAKGLLFQDGTLGGLKGSSLDSSFLTFVGGSLSGSLGAPMESKLVFGLRDLVLVVVELIGEIAGGGGLAISDTIEAA